MGPAFPLLAAALWLHTSLSAPLQRAVDLHRRGQYQQALAIYQDLVLSSSVASDAEVHAYVLSQIADVEIDLGKYDEAAGKSREAIALLQQTQKAQTSTFAVAARVLADALRAEGDDGQAKVVAEQALSVGRQTLDPLSPDLAFLLTSLGQIEKDLGDLRHAAQLCQAALSILQRNPSASPIDLGTAYQNMAVIESLRGHPKKAMANVDRAMASWNRVLPPDHPLLVYALETKFQACAKLKAFPQGEELLTRMLALLPSRFAPDHPERVTLLNNAAGFYVAEKDYGKAEPLLREAVDIARRQFPSGHPVARVVFVNYSFVLAKLDRKEDAARMKAEGEIVRAGALPANAWQSRQQR